MQTTMLERIAGGLFLIVLGAVVIRTRRGAHAYYSEAWRMGDTRSAWYAAALGPQVFRALQGLLGLALLGAGLWLLLTRD